MHATISFSLAFFSVLFFFFLVAVEGCFHWQNLLQYTSVVCSVYAQAILGMQQKVAFAIYKQGAAWSPLCIMGLSIFICLKEEFPMSLWDFLLPLTQPTLFTVSIIVEICWDFHFFSFEFDSFRISFPSHKESKRENHSSLDKYLFVNGPSWDEGEKPLCSLWYATEVCGFIKFCSIISTTVLYKPFNVIITATEKQNIKSFSKLQIRIIS